MIDWIFEHKHVLAWLAGLSIASLIVTAIALPFVVVKLPDDYFARDPHAPRAGRRGVLNLAWHIVKNVFGAAFLLAGVAMLVLPGQGLLTMLIGILMLDFPGKYRLERWLVRRRGVLSTMNRLRMRFERDPLWL